MFHTGRQYCPVDSIATSVTLQAISHARNRFRSRVKVRNFSSFIGPLLPAGGSTHTLTLFL